MKKPKPGENKEKIISSALICFATQGFEGTSIRKIASHAHVNIAAIGYYFKSKQSLFIHILQKKYLSMEEEINKISEQKNASIENLSISIFEIFFKNRHIVFNSFNLIWCHNLSIEDNFNFQGGYMGLPGYNVLLNKIDLIFGKTVEHDDKQWMAKCIFIQILHMIFIISSPHGKHLKLSESINVENAKRSIKKFSLMVYNNFI